MKRILLVLLVLCLALTTLPAEETSQQSELSEILTDFVTGSEKLNSGLEKVETGMEELRTDLDDVEAGLAESNSGLQKVETGQMLSTMRLDDLELTFNDYKAKTDLLIKTQQASLDSINLLLSIVLAGSTVYSGYKAYFDGDTTPDEVIVNVGLSTTLLWRLIEPLTIHNSGKAA